MPSEGDEPLGTVLRRGAARDAGLPGAAQVVERKRGGDTEPAAERRSE